MNVQAADLTTFSLVVCWVDLTIASINLKIREDLVNMAGHLMEND
jgi:hypothetical protein